MVILTTFPPPSEGIRHKQDHTQAHMRDKNLGYGTLFIAESRLSWVGTSGQGFSLEYPSISLHAVSRDTSTFPHECLYMMVEANLDKHERQPDSEDSSSGDEHETFSKNVTEVRFVPDDKTSIIQMYEAMSDCQALHPDENDSFSDDDDDYYDGSEGPGVLTTQAQALLERLEPVFEQGQEPEPAVGRSEQTNGYTTHDNVMETDECNEGQFDDANMGD